MGGQLFACDIDNTLIYSYKHARPDWTCVEWIHGREQAYMSPRTISLIDNLRTRLSLALITSRSREQFCRLKLPFRTDMAVTANGADLIVGDDIDAEWHSETESMLMPWLEEIRFSHARLSQSQRYIRCRIVDDAYAFAYCPESVKPEEEAQRISEWTALEVIASGKKIYLLPPPLNKGTALKRLMERETYTYVIAAGDGDMDIPMLREADAAIAPYALKAGLLEKTLFCPEDCLFSEYVMETVLEVSRLNKD